MKKVILNESQVATIVLDDVTSDKYYGAQIRDRKGFISRQGYGQGDFRLYAVDSVTVGNAWSFFDFPILSTVISRILDANNNVFEFDTAKELFKWLAE